MVARLSPREARALGATVPRATPRPRAPSKAEETLALAIRHAGLPEPTREHAFAAPERRWRLDFAWPDLKLAVEVEGMGATFGRHQRRSGFIKDCEKYEALLVRGWTLYRCPSAWIVGREARVDEVIDVLRQLLARSPGG